MNELRLAVYVMAKGLHNTHLTKFVVSLPVFPSSLLLQTQPVRSKASIRFFPYLFLSVTHNIRFVPNLNLLHYFNHAFITTKMVALKRVLPILYLASVCFLSLVLQIFRVLHISYQSSSLHDNLSFFSSPYSSKIPNCSKFIFSFLSFDPLVLGNHLELVTHFYILASQNQNLKRQHQTCSWNRLSTTRHDELWLFQEAH